MRRGARAAAATAPPHPARIERGPPPARAQTYVGHSHTFEKNLLRCAWSADGTRVSAGSADRNVWVWSAETRAPLYKLPGHKARRRGGPKARGRSCGCESPLRTRGTRRGA